MFLQTSLHQSITNGILQHYWEWNHSQVSTVGLEIVTYIITLNNNTKKKKKGNQSRKT